MTDLSAPRIHDLAVGPDADRACFRVYELWPGNAAATLQALREFDDQDGRLAPLILSRSPGCIPPAGLPASVPWLLVRTTVQADLKALRRILVDPLVETAAIGVDFADHAAALARGGRIDLWHSDVSSASAAALRIADQVSGWSPAERAGAAVLVHVRAARHLAIKAITHVGAVAWRPLIHYDRLVRPPRRNA